MLIAGVSAPVAQFPGQAEFAAAEKKAPPRLRDHPHNIEDSEKHWKPVKPSRKLRMGRHICETIQEIAIIRKQNYMHTFACICNLQLAVGGVAGDRCFVNCFDRAGFVRDRLMGLPCASLAGLLTFCLPCISRCQFNCVHVSSMPISRSKCSQFPRGSRMVP
jgi:hypothetical protein